MGTTAAASRLLSGPALRAELGRKNCSQSDAAPILLLCDHTSVVGIFLRCARSRTCTAGRALGCANRRLIRVVHRLCVFLLQNNGAVAGHLLLWRPVRGLCVPDVCVFIYCSLFLCGVSCELSSENVLLTKRRMLTACQSYTSIYSTWCDICCGGLEGIQLQVIWCGGESCVV